MGLFDIALGILGAMGLSRMPSGMRRSVFHAAMLAAMEEEEQARRPWWDDGVIRNNAVDINPRHYPSEAAYNAAVDAEFEARYGWREKYGDCVKNVVNQYEYETEEEYLDAVYNKKYGWRRWCRDGSDYYVYPSDYETKEEYDRAFDEAYYGWRECCDDFSEYGIYPNDYETVDEYYDAYEEAYYAWRESCEDGSEYGIYPYDYETLEEYNVALDKVRVKPEDYPNMRTYKAADGLERILRYYPDKKYMKDEKKRYKFILNNPDIIASHYLTPDGEFLFAQAAKENFSLPIEFPHEDEDSLTELGEMLRLIYKKDKELAFDVWDWCLDKFASYIDYSEYVALNEFFIYGKDIYKKMAEYISRNKGFGERLIAVMDDDCDECDLYQLLTAALYINPETATMLMECILKNKKIRVNTVKCTIDEAIGECCNDDEVETIELFRDTLFPVIEQLAYKTVKSMLPKWNKEIDEYIYDMESWNSKYTYSRRNIWRTTCEDGSEYGVDPVDYETEEEYIEALNEEKYSWRSYCDDGSQYGIIPGDYETEEEYYKALDGVRYAWRARCEDGSKYGVYPEFYKTEEEYLKDLRKYKIAPEDYPNKRKYLTAKKMAEQKRFYGKVDYSHKHIRRYDFILNNPDILASHYLTHCGEYLFAQAVKENFDLPVSFPHEDEEAITEFSEIIRKIYSRNIPLAFDVWDWCLETFMPYMEYSCYNSLTEIPLYGSDTYKEIGKYIEHNNDFGKRLVSFIDDPTCPDTELCELLKVILHNKMRDAARVLLESVFENKNYRYTELSSLCDCVIKDCYNYMEYESIETLREILFPLIQKHDSKKLKSRVNKWNREIDEYVLCIKRINGA